MGQPGLGRHCGAWGQVAERREVGGPGGWSRWVGGRPLLRLVSQAKQISPELSALAVYCCAARLQTLRPPPVPPQPCQVSSLSERKAKKLIREAGGSQDVGHLRQEGGGDQRTPGGWEMLTLIWKGE